MVGVGGIRPEAVSYLGRPESVAPDQTIRLAIFLQQVLQRRSLRSGSLEREFQASRRKQPGNFRKAQFPGATILNRVERGAANSRFAREFGLSEL